MWLQLQNPCAHHPTWDREDTREHNDCISVRNLFSIDVKVRVMEMCQPPSLEPARRDGDTGCMAGECRAGAWDGGGIITGEARHLLPGHFCPPEMH